MEGPLVLHRCTGTFNRMPPEIGRELLKFDKCVEKLRNKIRLGTATTYEREAFAYLNQVINNYLFCWFDDERVGNYDKPVEFDPDWASELPMDNALKNMRNGDPWDKGATRPEDLGDDDDANNEEHSPAQTRRRVTRSSRRQNRNAAASSFSGVRTRHNQEAEESDEGSDVQFVEIKPAAASIKRSSTRKSPLLTTTLLFMELIKFSLNIQPLQTLSKLLNMKPT